MKKFLITLVCLVLTITMLSSVTLAANPVGKISTSIYYANSKKTVCGSGTFNRPTGPNRFLAGTLKVQLYSSMLPAANGKYENKIETNTIYVDSSGKYISYSASCSYSNIKNIVTLGKAKVCATFRNDLNNSISTTSYIW